MGCNILAFVITRTYSNQLSEYHEQCVAMVSEVNQALEYLKEMQEKHKFVSHKTGALHHACEQLMEDQVCGNDALLLSSSICTSACIWQEIGDYY